MLECTNCGAVGESYFSTNYFGELVCELCGTQSFLQARNETQDVEDTTMDPMRVGNSLKRQRRKRGRNGGANATQDSQDADQAAGGKRKKRRRRVELRDCLLATQTVLDSQAQALVERVGEQTFPREAYPRVVRGLWFRLLGTWRAKGERPLLRCFTEFFLNFGGATTDDDALDPAITRDLLEQWDAEHEQRKAEEEERARLPADQKNRAEEELPVESTVVPEQHDEPNQLIDTPKHKSGRRRKISTSKVYRVKSWNTKRSQSTGPRRQRIKDHGAKLDRFSILDLLGLLMLASRVLNLGLLPCDFARWVDSGVLPFHNLLATCCADAPDVRDAVADIAMFFDSTLTRHKVSTARIAFHAHHLQFHMELRLPPLNTSLAAHRMCTALGLPREVFRNFQWLTGHLNTRGVLPELPMLLQDAGPRTPILPKEKVDALLGTSVGIVAHLVTAVKMCGNWHEWVFEKDDKASGDAEVRAVDGIPPARTARDLQCLSRRNLEAFTRFCEQALVDSERAGLPPGFESHVDHLQRLETLNELLDPRHGASQEDKATASLHQHVLVAYPAVHINGVCIESDEQIEQRLERLRRAQNGGDGSLESAVEAENPAEQDEGEAAAYFYPLYHQFNQHGALHAAYENVLELLCQHVDTPIYTVLPLVRQVDRHVQRLSRHFVHRETGYQYRLEKIQAHIALMHAKKAEMTQAGQAKPKKVEVDSEFEAESE